MESRLNSSLVKDVEDKPTPQCWYKNVCEAEIGECGPTKCTKFIVMKNLMDTSDLPKNKQSPIRLVPDNCDLESFRLLSQIKANILEFVKSGKNIYLTSGQVGNGKTSWGIKLLHSYFNAINEISGFEPHGKFVHVPKLLHDLKDFENHPITDDYLNELCNVDVVVWDDIGVQGSNFDINNLMWLIDNRILNGKSNIFTGNITTYEEMARVYNDRLASRIFVNSFVVEFKGSDRREPEESIYEWLDKFK